MAWEIFSNPWFYAIIAGLAFFAWGTIRPIVKNIPLVNKQTLMLLGIGGFLIAGGYLGDVMSSTDTASMAGMDGSFISDLQVTTSFATDVGGTVSEDSLEKNLVHLRATDAELNETAGYYEIDDGIITVYRTGELNAISCPVVASTPSYKSEVDTTDGSTYQIVESTTTGDLEVYLNAQPSGSGAAAATTSPRQKTTLSFAEGVSQAHLGVLIEGSETGHDELAQYSSRDVTVSICNKPFIFRIHRMD